MPYTVLSQTGLKMQLYADQVQGKNVSTGQRNSLIHTLENGKLALDLRPDREESKLVKEQSEFTLVGHAGPVFAVSISLDEKFLISGSQDCTIRRWSLQTRSCLVVYHGHQFPVWDVKFAPLGYYFASCSNDRTANVWNMKQHTPVRIFAGHMSDVECI